LAKSQQIFTKTTYWINVGEVANRKDRDKDSWRRGTVTRIAKCVVTIKIPLTK
jgi:hypothetical protein